MTEAIGIGADGRPKCSWCLGTTVYDPSVHYHQVRDAWIGVRTPDGR